MIAEVDNFSNREIRGTPPKSRETSYIHFAPSVKSMERKKQNQTSKQRDWTRSNFLFFFWLFFSFSSLVRLSWICSANPPWKDTFNRGFQSRGSHRRILGLSKGGYQGCFKTQYILSEGDFLLVFILGMMPTQWCEYLLKFILWKKTKSSVLLLILEISVYASIESLIFGSSRSLPT